MDIGFCLGLEVRPLLKSLYRIHVLLVLVLGASGISVQIRVDTGPLLKFAHFGTVQLRPTTTCQIHDP